MALAVVTGAARGIGAASAIALANAGWDLYLIDICADIEGLPYSLATPADLDSVVATCAGRGVSVEQARVDVRDGSAVLDVLAGKPVRAAVAAAGVIAGAGDAWSVDASVIETDLAVNYLGVINLARAVMPTMIASGSGGRFVSIVSTAGQTGLPRLASYSAAKHAALGYTRALAAEVIEHGITCNAVLPGSTDTDLLAATAKLYEASVDDLVSWQRLGRAITPSEVAAAVTWLCSAEASAITGAAIPVDGGFRG